MSTEPKMCIACYKDIAGRPVELRPPDPKMALCASCGRVESPRDKESSDDGRPA